VRLSEGINLHSISLVIIFLQAVLKSIILAIEEKHQAHGRKDSCIVAGLKVYACAEGLRYSFQLRLERVQAARPE